VADGERIVVESPGAGGYGSPAERSHQAIDRDRTSRKFSEPYLAKHYGCLRAAE
jgi:N-methylhydantoinase B